MSHLPGYPVDANNARRWVDSQYQSFAVESGAALALPNDHLQAGAKVRIGNNGIMDGTFTLSPSRSSTPCPITINTPSPASNVVSGFTGTIGGVLDSSQVGSGAQFQVKAYVLTDIEYLQWTATVTSDYTFVSSGNGQAAKEWRLRVINVSSGNTEPWPYWSLDVINSDVYDNLFCQYWKVTDIPYLQKSIRATTSNVFTFDTTSGSTLFKVVDSADFQLGRWNTRTGLVRSYVLDATNSDWSGGIGAGFEERGYLYDNALAILAYAKRDTDTFDRIQASQIANALVRIQNPDGGFPFSQNHMSVTGADKYYRSGAIAWAAYALLKTYSIFSFGASLNASHDQAGVKAAGKSALDYLHTLIRPEYGTLSGGSGVYVSGVFSESAIIPWHSTEHNIDAWFAFRQGELVFDSTTYADARRGILGGLLQNHWYESEGRFWQGIGSDGVPDSQGALDVHTWGSILLDAHKAQGRIDSIWPRVDSNYSVVVSGTSGLKAYSSAEGYPGAVDALWAEGTFGEIYAKQLHGATSPTSLGDMINFQEASGAFAYSVNRADLTYEINSYESLASTAWFLLVAELDQFIWNEGIYDDAASDWFKNEIGKKVPLGANGSGIIRRLTMGSSDYSDRVVRWPSFKREVDNIKPISLTVPLANDDKALNYIFNNTTLLNQDVTLQMGLVDSDGNDELMDLFKGKIESSRMSGGQLSISLLDRFKGFTETILGDTTSGGALQFVNSDHLPGDLMWTMVTCYGGFDTTQSSANTDINYASFIDWKNIFIGDSILLNAKFTGQKMSDFMTKMGKVLDSSFIFENNKLKFYRGSIQVSSEFNNLDNSSIKKVEVRLDEKKIVNKFRASGGWSVDSNYYTINQTDVDSASQVTYGVRDDKLEDSVVWLSDEASALNLAERYVFKGRNPLLNYEIKSTLGALYYRIGDGLNFDDQQLDVASTTNFYVEGFGVDMDTGETIIKTRNMPQLPAFILDVDTYSVLDKDYNFLL